MGPFLIWEGASSTQPLKVTQNRWSMAGVKISEIKVSLCANSVMMISGKFWMVASDHLTSVLGTFLVVMTKYLTKSHLKEERFVLSLQCSRYNPLWWEGVVRREWGGCSHLLQWGTISQRFHNIPKQCHWLETKCSDTRIWETFQF